MSILLIEFLPQGIIFGADRNITHRIEKFGTTKVEVHGQTQERKVLRWPNRKALIGYVGAAEIGGIPTAEWLYDFIGDHLNFDSLESLATSLCSKVQEQRLLDEKGASPELLNLHIAGFEEREQTVIPILYHIRNYYDFQSGQYCDVRKEFISTPYPWECPPAQLKAALAAAAQKYQPMWVHQGEDLGTFNTLEEFLRLGFGVLCRGGHGEHRLPQTLQDWERQVRMAILTYAAYFQSYKGPGEQYVGGGVDTVSLEWPDNRS